MTTGNELFDKVILVGIFTLLQVPLWAWAGIQARKVFSWWPL